MSRDGCFYFIVDCRVKPDNDKKLTLFSSFMVRRRRMGDCFVALLLAMTDYSAFVVKSLKAYLAGEKDFVAGSVPLKLTLPPLKLKDLTLKPSTRLKNQ
jgi:hypothetical protein